MRIVKCDPCMIMIRLVSTELTKNLELYELVETGNELVIKCSLITIDIYI